MKRRRLGFVVAATIGVLAVAIAAIPLIQAGGSRELEGPALVPRPIVIAILLGLPAGLAAIAASRDSRPMFIGAGVVCLLQSIVGALSGVTFVFLIPAVLLIGLGLEETQDPWSKVTRRRAWVGGTLVVAMGIAAWIMLFATSETVCWIARAGIDGTPVYTRIPVSDTMSLGPGDVAGGCVGGTFTMQGLLVGAVLAIGALAMAGLTAGIATRPFGARSDR